MNRTQRTTTRAIVIVLLTLLLVGAIAWEWSDRHGASRLAEARDRFERDVGPIDLAAYVRAELPPLENPGIWFARGMAALVLTDGEQDAVTRMVRAPVDTWTEEERAALQRVHTRNGPAFELIGRGRSLAGDPLRLTDLTTDLGVNYGAGMSARLPSLIEAIQTSRLLSTLARDQVRYGDVDGALDLLETLSVLAYAHRREPLLLIFLTGLSIEGMQLIAVRDLLAERELDATDLQRVRALRIPLDDDATFRRACAFEGAGAYRDRPTRIGPLAGWFDLRFGDHLDLLRQQARAAELPFPEARAAEARLRDQDPAALSEVPSFVGLAGRIHRNRTLRRMAEFTIELRAYGSAHGRYPDRIDEVTGEPLADSLDGLPLEYAVQEAGSARLTAPGATETARKFDLYFRRTLDALRPFDWTVPAPPS